MNKTIKIKFYFCSQNADAKKKFKLSGNADVALVKSVDTLVAVMGKITDLLDDCLLDKVETNVGDLMVMDGTGAAAADLKSASSFDLQTFFKLGNAAADLDFSLDVITHGARHRTKHVLAAKNQKGKDNLEVHVVTCWKALENKVCPDLEMISGVLAVAGNVKASEVNGILPHFAGGLTAMDKCWKHCDSNSEQRQYSAAVAACIVDEKVAHITDVKSGENL